MALELQAYDGDGAESSVASSVHPTRHKKATGAGSHKRKAPPRAARVESDDGDEEDEDNDNDNEAAEGSQHSNSESENDGDELQRPPKRKQRAARGSATEGPDASMLASAAFGTFYDGGAASDVESSAGCSQTSTERRDAAHRAAFPVKGVDCVGCVLAGKVAPVVRFVNENAARMSDIALWKMAALCYQRDVVEPARVEGVVAPPWGWREVRIHFQHHCTDTQLDRLQTLRLLKLARTKAEQRLLRIEATGEQELDKSGMDQVLKIINMETKERQLFEASIGAVAGGSARGAKAKAGRPNE